MPSLRVDVNSWRRLACYPRGSFYPISHGPSTRYRRITWPGFRPCSTCRSRSQAPLCPCTRRVISIHPEGTFGRLRYILGGDRPSQTAHQARSSCLLRSERVDQERVVFHRWLRRPQEDGIKASHLSYAFQAHYQCQTTVKLHGVFLSCGG